MRILNPTIIIFLVTMLIASCRGSREGGRKESVTNTSAASASAAERKAFAKEYSQKLGIAVPELANPLLIKTISEWLGVPYKFGGNDKKGVDCSGFINKVYPIVYQLNVPRVAAQIQQKATPVTRKGLQEGDLVFFKINTKEVGHAGIYLFDDFFVHASTSRGVMISRLEDTYWNKYFVGGGRFSR
jgi:lipoprotein Spr